MPVLQRALELQRARNQLACARSDILISNPQNYLVSTDCIYNPVLFWTAVMLHAVSEARRQFLYHKVLQSFQVAITVCDAIPELPHFKRPPAKISTHRLFSDFIEESNSEVFDIVVDGFPWELQSHELISMVWYSWPASSISFAAINLDPKTLRLKK